MIIITGASDGLGRELAKLYQMQGTGVVNISRRECEFAKVNISADLTRIEDINSTAKQISDMSDKITALINCIGVWGEESIEDMSEAETDILLATNIKAPMLLISRLINRIKDDKSDVVNVISTAGLKGNKDHMAYAASKWGERGFTEALRSELKDTESRVISFYPGGMKTKFFEKNLGEDITDDGTYWMDPASVALCLKQLLDLPKNIEVSEITLNRKKAK